MRGEFCKYNKETTSPLPYKCGTLNALTFQASFLFLLMSLVQLQKGLFTLPGISKWIPLELSIIFHCLHAISNYHISLVWILGKHQLVCWDFFPSNCMHSLQCSCLLQEGWDLGAVGSQRAPFWKSNIAFYRRIHNAFQWRVFHF